MVKRPSKHPLPHSRLTKYWKIRRIKRKTPSREIKRTPGKTKKFVKGAGTKVWVGKEITRDGWMSEKKWREMNE